ncbi:MAG: PVC-type heme-binding CxxCH protein [Anditalea sp.]
MKSIFNYNQKNCTKYVHGYCKHQGIAHYLIYFCILLFGCHNNHKSKFKDINEKAMSSFEIAEGFQIELIAAEPLLSDPVAMEIDEYGRMYIIEMHGYPLDKSGSGNIKILSDSDGDGVMDKKVLFAENLNFPTGILRWKKGLLVTDPPNLLYFEDSNEDEIADIRDTLLTGFALSNPQHNFNSPILGIDNWIYLSNEPATVAKVYTEEFSDLGSKVKFYKNENSPQLPPNAGGRRVRLKPDVLKLETMSSASQFGHTFDQWGRHFLVSNANHIYHEVIQAPYLVRNPNLLISGATNSISDHGPAAEIFSITENPEHQLLTDVGVFTAACGIMAYQGGLFPPPYDNAIFVAEPVGNLVHVDQINEAGATFTASRILKEKEFLASRDSWFRPVNHYIGPDGALYVVDYYRRVIEHPEWMAVEATSNLYDGIDQGRIYRITPKGTPKAGWSNALDLSSKSDSDLVHFLSHSNIWYRRNAQRLLLDRKSLGVIDQLKEMVGSDTSQYGRLHAAWTLEGLGALEKDQVLILLQDPEPGIRENAIVLAEQFLSENPSMEEALISLRDDENGRVRFQLMCTLGEVVTPEANQVREQMLISGIEDSWMQVAALSAVNPDYTSLLNTAIKNFAPSNPAFGDLIERLTSMLAADNQIKEIKNLIQMALSEESQREGAWQAAILRGLVKGIQSVDFNDPNLEPEKNLIWKAIFSQRPETVRQASLELMQHTGLPKGENTQKVIEKLDLLINDHEADLQDRQLAIKVKVIADPQSIKEILTKLLVPNETFEIQKTAIETIRPKDGLEVAHFLIEQWPSLTPNIRDEVIGTFTTSEQRIRILLDALEKGTIDPSAVSWRRQVGLMAQAEETLRHRSRKIFADQSNKTAKKEVLDDYSQELGTDGDPILGKVVYQKNCSICHQIGGEYGTAVGPDLASIRNRDPKAILVDILDPNLTISDGYDLWEIRLQDGEIKQGIIGSETSGSLTLRIFGMDDELISRQQIESIKSTGISLMPAGLENQISKKEMTDLLSFIKNPQ